MKLKLMISALVFCSSLSFAGDDATVAPSTSSPKKKAKPAARPASTAAVQAPEAAGLGGLGTSGTSGASPKQRKVVELGTGSAPR